MPSTNSKMLNNTAQDQATVAESRAALEATVAPKHAAPQHAAPQHAMSFAAAAAKPEASSARPARPLWSARRPSPPRPMSPRSHARPEERRLDRAVVRGAGAAEGLEGPRAVLPCPPLRRGGQAQVGLRQCSQEGHQGRRCHAREGGFDESGQGRSDEQPLHRHLALPRR